MSEKLHLNQTFSTNFSFSQQDVADFARVTGDNNPVHLDEDFASKTIFKTRIMHGMLGACVFSKVFGTLFPGDGTIYLSQSVNFLKPMYVDITYDAHFEVLEILEKNRARISTSILSQEGKKVVVGEAIVMNIEKISL
jgi:3-hydroxybutyryl-CoA dehydratase